MIGTYLANGRVNPLPYTFIRQTTSGTETLSNTGRGNPVQGGTGLFRSFGPSDDATIFQLFVAANMMFSRYLASCAGIM
jgi:meiotically up-regulated gene 157 (Mug157) protein